mgnify:CR=1 FL=1
MVSMIIMIIGRFFFVSVVGRAIGMDMTVFARFMTLIRLPVGSLDSRAGEIKS